MTPREAAYIVNRSETHRCLNCKADLEPLGEKAWWLVTRAGEYLTDEELVGLAKGMVLKERDETL